MRRKNLFRGLLLAVLAFTLLAASPPGCATFSDACGCNGSLAKTRVGNGYQVTMSVACSQRTQGWVDVYRHSPTGSTTHIGYCPLDWPGGWIPESCSVIDGTALVDWYETTTGLNNGPCAGLFKAYNGV